MNIKTKWLWASIVQWISF